MNEPARYLLASIALGTTSLIAQAQPAALSATQAVTALEKQWTQSERTNDVALMAPLLADKFIGIGLDGKISNRDQELSDAKAIKYASVVVEEFHVTVSGHTAIATMIFKAKLSDATGPLMDINARWADTWVKMPNGTWQCLLSQGSALP